MNIHEQAVTELGARERLNHLRKEAIELAHEIDRYLDGKSNAELVVGEAHDVAYLAKSLAHIEGFEDFCAATHQHYLNCKSESRLKDALKNAQKATESDDIDAEKPSIRCEAKVAPSAIPDPIFKAGYYDLPVMRQANQGGVK